MSERFPFGVEVLDHPRSSSVLMALNGDYERGIIVSGSQNLRKERGESKESRAGEKRASTRGGGRARE